MKPKNFEIDEAYLTDVNVRKVHDHVKDRANPTPDELIMILKGRDQSVSIYNTDHEEFTKLREELGRLGYIKIQRGWWNGDRVLKSFKLNGWVFKKGHKFPCASALGVNIRCAREHGWPSISYV